MEFFVPQVDGSGPMDPDAAEAAWIACRKGAETDAGAQATNRRIYSVRFARNGKTVTATVGGRDPYYDQEIVMAIIEVRGVYKICCSRRGYLQIGDTPMVGIGEARAVEFVASED